MHSRTHKYICNTHANTHARTHTAARVYELLEDRLKNEDKNSGGSLSRASLLAGLAAVGIPPAQAFGSRAQKCILDLLEVLGKGEIRIADFLALIFHEL